MTHDIIHLFKEYLLPYYQGDTLLKKAIEVTYPDIKTFDYKQLNKLYFECIVDNKNIIMGAHEILLINIPVKIIKQHI